MQNWHIHLLVPNHNGTFSANVYANMGHTYTSYLILLILKLLTSMQTWHIHMLVPNRHGAYPANFYENLPHTYETLNNHVLT